MPTLWLNTHSLIICIRVWVFNQSLIFDSTLFCCCCDTIVVLLRVCFTVDMYFESIFIFIFIDSTYQLWKLSQTWYAVMGRLFSIIGNRWFMKPSTSHVWYCLDEVSRACMAFAFERCVSLPKIYQLAPCTLCSILEPSQSTWPGDLLSQCGLNHTNYL